MEEIGSQRTGYTESEINNATAVYTEQSLPKVQGTDTYHSCQLVSLKKKKDTVKEYVNRTGSEYLESSIELEEILDGC